MEEELSREDQGDQDLRKDVVQDDSVSLPEVRDGYKYLGITQLERDAGFNEVAVEDRVLKELETIMDSNLAVPNRMFNFLTPG